MNFELRTTPALCLTLCVSSLDELERRIRRYAGGVDWIEARLDALEKPRLPKLPEKSGSGFIATCRPRREGGAFQGSERERLRLLEDASRSGFAWVDVEHDVEEGLDLASSAGVLRSFHDFQGFPHSLGRLHRRLLERGDAAKIAVTVSDSGQLVRLLEWMSQRPPVEQRVVLGMGEMGQPSRLLGAFSGNLWTYVAEGSQSPAAPGQFGLRQARELYRLQQWRAAPRLYGVIGNPVAHSQSPLLHNRLFRHYGVDGLYLPLLLDRLEHWFAFVRRSALPFEGFSVTLPFKRAVLEFLERNDSPIGSVNTLSRRSGGGWRGSNTDYQGFLNPLLRRRRISGARVLVLGNGGVARTVVKALRDQKARVTAVGRDRERVESFAREIGCSAALFEDLPLEAEICVNTTPVGQHPRSGASPLPSEHNRFDLVYDLVYNPRRTRLLRQAEEQGAETISGIEMFIEQAALQFRLWTGIDPDRRLMADILSADGSPDS